MAPQIELISGVRSRRIPLEADRVTIGKAAENDVPLEDDPTASRLHAVLEHFSAGWCVSDLGSSNGTSVNGERIWASHRLQRTPSRRLVRTGSVACALSRRASWATSGTWWTEAGSLASRAALAESVARC